VTDVGIVDENIQASCRRNDFLCSRLDLSFVCHIEGESESLAATFLNRSSYTTRRLDLDIADDDVCALLGIEASDGFPNPRTSTGDQSNFAI
jgi:hypothetical protein